MSDAKKDSKVVDVDLLYPFPASGGAAAPSLPGSGDGSVTPTVENALRDVLGWRPRGQDSAAFTAALAATFKLEVVEDHVVATYTPRGYAMAADLGGVTGGQASLYSRMLAAKPQMITLLDGLTPLIPDFDKENGEAYRTLVRDAVSALTSELGTTGGPRKPVVNALLRQLIGMRLIIAVSRQDLNADTVEGQLGELRKKFGLESRYVNNVEQEGIRTTFWTLTDLVLDIVRAWVAIRDNFGATGNQQGFLGTQLVLINRLLSAVAEQLDDLESSLDSVYVSAAERETIQLPHTDGLTVDGLLGWIRTFVTEDGPRIARDTGRDGLRTSFMPSLLSIGHATDELTIAVGTKPTQDYPRPLRGNAGIPPGMRAARVQATVKGLDSLLWQLTETTVSLTKEVVLFTVDGRHQSNPATIDAAKIAMTRAKKDEKAAQKAVAAARGAPTAAQTAALINARTERNRARTTLDTAQKEYRFRITLHGLNFPPRSRLVLSDPSKEIPELAPVRIVEQTRESISADFSWPVLDAWQKRNIPNDWPKSWPVFARDLPILLKDSGGRPIRDVQTRP